MATAKELLEVAVRQLNVREDPPGSNNVRYNTWYYGREVSGKRRTTEHCGIVEAVLPGYGVQAIEGNTSESWGL